MSDERVRVLQMLEQGLITYEQSLALLNALGGQAPAPKGAGAAAQDNSSEDDLVLDDREVDDLDTLEDDEEDHEDEAEEHEDDEDDECMDCGSNSSFRLNTDQVVADVRGSLDSAYQDVKQAMSHVSREMRHVGPQVSGEVRDAMQEVARDVGEAMRSVGEELREALAEVQSSGGWGFGWRNTYTFRDEEELAVTEGVNIFDLTISTKNGNVKVAAADTEVIKLQVVKKIQADNKQMAQETADTAVVRTLEESGERLVLKLTVPDIVSGVAVSFDLRIPKRLVAEVNILSKNGGIYLEELSGSAQVESKNGELRILGGNYRSLIAETKNGSAKLMATVQDGSIVTKNGSVRCLLKPANRGQLNLESKNGSVVLEVPQDADQGYSVDASSVHGSVNIDLPDFRVSLSDRKHRQGQTADFAAKEKQLAIAANTKNGSVTIKALP